MWDRKIRRNGAKDARIRKQQGQKSLWPVRLYGSILVLLFCAACGDAPIPPLTATPTRALSGPTLEPSPTTDVHPPTEYIAEDNILGGPGQNIPEAADIAANSALPPVIEGTPGAFAGSQRVQLTMPDGVLLAGDIYQTAAIDNGTPQPPIRMPGVLLLSASIADWGDFPARLRDAGYTVLVMELRDSSSVADFTTMLRALSEANTVNPGLMAVIGAGQGADLALIGCAVDLLCDTAVLLSPVSRDTLLNVMPNYNPRPLLIAASVQDTNGVQTGEALRVAATGEVVFQPIAAAGSGAALIFNAPDLTGVIGTWLAEKLVE